MRSDNGNSADDDTALVTSERRTMLKGRMESGADEGPPCMRLSPF